MSGIIKNILQERVGVAFWASILILNSLRWFIYGISWERYVNFFSPMDVMALKGRYVLSILTRLVTIGLAIGLLMKKELARRYIIVFFSVNILMLPLRHPLHVFEKIIQIRGFDLNPLVLWGMALGIDFIFSGIILYYFSKGAVKQYFIEGKNG